MSSEPHDFVGPILTLAGTLLTALLAYWAAVRNAAKQVNLESRRNRGEEQSKREALLAEVHQQATTSGKELYQTLCQEQQKRIDQQHDDLVGLASDVAGLRGQLADTQRELLITQSELAKTRGELKDTRGELQETRALLQTTKDELVASRASQEVMRTETEGLRQRIVELEAELSKYRSMEG